MIGCTWPRNSKPSSQELQERMEKLAIVGPIQGTYNRVEWEEFWQAVTILLPAASQVGPSGSKGVSYEDKSVWKCHNL